MSVSCAVCDEVFECTSHACVTPCGHIFHHNCLTKWVERSNTCPQCRCETTECNIQKVFLNYQTDYSGSAQESSHLQVLVQAGEDQLESLRNETKKLRDKVLLLKVRNLSLTDTIDALKKQFERECTNEEALRNAKVLSLEEQNAELQQTVATLQKEKETADALRKELDALTEQHKQLCAQVDSSSRYQRTLSNEEEEIVQQIMGLLEKKQAGDVSEVTRQAPSPGTSSESLGSSSEQAHRGRKVNTRYILCKYFLYGCCRAGDECQFLHPGRNNPKC